MDEPTADATGPDQAPEPASGPEPSAKAEPEPDHENWLGDFRRGPAVFSVHRETAGAHPLVPPEYRIECNDGAGPRVICRFTDEPDPVPEWFGAWRGDEWCTWILKQTRALIANPQRDLPGRCDRDARITA
ncbi:hypothetical protein LO763_18750 [Glycomyces sp. A-F 0318]|uniref:hypothetical protein n=1 Tax=Glycomyces amatae TaxID=2881355 RepID=UPI001E3981E3|nr:hypothetical protein [Glycomyces amatae]MCD0445649.1 hypothetical protein [Glycomyces amatae]